MYSLLLTKRDTQLWLLCVFTKEVNAAAWSFLGEYRMTKLGVSHFVCNKLYELVLIILQLILLQSCSETH